MIANLFKTRPRWWLRIGTTFFLIDLFILSGFLTSGPESDSSIGVQITNPIIFWFGSLHESNPVLQKILIATQGLVGYFIIGAIIGLLITKIKIMRQSKKGDDSSTSPTEY
jgi:hypothetical protein